jgi:sugar phosphate isomerase/epimerase
MKPTNRRDFLKTSFQAGLALGGLGLLAPGSARAIEPVQRKGKAHFKLSLVGYSFRRYFTEKDPTKKITLLDFIDFCADHGITAAEMTGYYFPQPLTEEYLHDLKKHMYLRGVNASGTSLGANFAPVEKEKLRAQIDSVKKWVDVAVALGAPYIRVFANKAKGVELADAQKQCIESIQECAEYAGTKGVYIGLENDQGITMNAEQTLTLIHGVKSPWFGLNLDLGNFKVADPYADVKLCAPYAINVHCKVSTHPSASKEPEPADYRRQFQILRDVNYQGYIALEYEAEPDPYTAVPEMMKKVLVAF